MLLLIAATLRHAAASHTMPLDTCLFCRRHFFMMLSRYHAHLRFCHASSVAVDIVDATPCRHADATLMPAERLIRCLKAILYCRRADDAIGCRHAMPPEVMICRFT